MRTTRPSASGTWCLWKARSVSSVLSMMSGSQARGHLESTVNQRFRRVGDRKGVPKVSRQPPPAIPHTEYRRRATARSMRAMGAMPTWSRSQAEQQSRRRVLSGRQLRATRLPPTPDQRRGSTRTRRRQRMRRIRLDGVRLEDGGDDTKVGIGRAGEIMWIRQQ